MKLTICIFLSMAFCEIGFAQSSPNQPPSFSYCRGYNSLGGIVSGSCSNGIFSGYSGSSGRVVTGTCQKSGAFQAYDPIEGGMIYGSCY